MTEATLETVIFFEKKVSITPKEMNEIKTKSVDEMVLQKAKNMVENKCSEHGFILPGSVTLISRSMGYFESARFTGDSNYYVKLKGKVLYPVDGLQVTGTVIRRNNMGLYVNYNDAIHIQVPRDLHIGDLRYDDVQIGDSVIIELKRSKFAINDPFILSSGQFISKEGENTSAMVEKEPEEEESEPEEEPEVEQEPEVEEEVEPEVEAEVEPEVEVEPELEEKSEETAPPSINIIPTIAKPIKKSTKPRIIVEDSDEEPVAEPVVEPVAVKEGGAKKRRSKGKQI